LKGSGALAYPEGVPPDRARNGDWLKIKCVQSESFVVIGHGPSSSMGGAIGSLALAGRKGKGLVYVGSVGSGFRHQQARDLKKQLDAVKVEKPAAPVNEKGLIFCAPDPVAEIEFRRWTGDRKLRHASFKGLRDRPDNAKVFRIEG
jgi:bifunctional non-homologous end joining protein LigD